MIPALQYASNRMRDRLRKAREKRARFKRLASEMRAEFGAMHYPTLAEWFWGRRA